MVSQIQLHSYIEGYNPPEFYKRISSPDEANSFLSSGVVYNTTGKVSFDNHLGTVNIASNIETEEHIRLVDCSVITIDDPSYAYVFVGKINSLRKVSEATAVVQFDVDWYTSQIISSYKYSRKLPTADTVLCRRLTAGEMSYSDEGIPPKNITYTKTSDWSIMLGDNTKWPYFLLVYAEGEGIFWFTAHKSQSATHLEIVSASDIFYACMVNKYGYDELEFDPRNVLFYGFINTWQVPLKEEWAVGNTYFGSMTTVVEGSSTGPSSLPNLTTITLNLDNDLPVSTMYERYAFIDMDGTVLYEVPIGVGISKTENIVCSCNFNPSTPSLTFELPSYINGSHTLTLGFKPLPFVIDSEQVYIAEEKATNTDMRNLQTLNGIVSGLMGSGTQGASAYAFSRSSGAYKAGIATGVSAGGAMAQGAFEYFVTNKAVSSLEQERAKAQADSLAISGGVSPLLQKYGGLYKIEYDTTTKTNIQAYQNRFGYKTSQIDTNKNLNTYENYIEADVIITGGLRKEVENYIKQMFSNGVRFT